MTPEPLERMDRIERVEKWLTALALSLIHI